MSALLHALAALCPTPFTSQVGVSCSMEEDEEAVPVTSLACQWKAPKKRNESTQKISDVLFEKHVYGRTKKKSMKSLEDFDPRPEEYHQTAMDNLPSLLDSIRGEGLCISLLLDQRTCQVTDIEQVPSSSLPSMPSHQILVHSVAEFKRSLCVTDEEARRI